MSGVFLDITPSPDGFAAEPDTCRENPLGRNGRAPAAHRSRLRITAEIGCVQYHLDAISTRRSHASASPDR